MTETANILNNATQRSLIVSWTKSAGAPARLTASPLAWSIVEHLHHQVGAKTLFATHYHELTELAARLPRLKNFNVAVREWNDQVVFLHKIIAGGTDKSYGIQVARLAGVPGKQSSNGQSKFYRTWRLPNSHRKAMLRAPRRQQDREKLKSLAPAPQMDLFGA